jgi:ubiquinone/menaquinone biosynthesis C-methylase UbiE
MTDYDPEVYWSRVAQEIEKRGESYIAGDDNPYYHYKRRKFLKEFLDTIDFQSKTVLEVGFGPGGNLKHIATHHAPKKIFGADVSPKMLELAAKNLSMHEVTLRKIDGANLPYPAQAMDISLTVTVLQHNTDQTAFKKLVGELSRVTKTTIVIMEDIGEGQSETGEWILRPVEIYRSVFAECGFRLSNVRFLNTKITRSWYESIHRRFISSRHQEGDPISPAVKYLIRLPMPVTRRLDEMFVEKGNLAKMVFERA